MTTDNFCFYLQNRLIQTSQTGGQQYSDTSPFSIPWPMTSKKSPTRATDNEKEPKLILNHPKQSGKAQPAQLIMNKEPKLFLNHPKHIRKAQTADSNISKPILNGPTFSKTPNPNDL
jgi:hypothetical protein